MTRALAATFGLQAALMTAIVLVALDIRAHTRVESLGGVNMWGYRGPVLHEKQAQEMRIAIVGGDLAFGWGVAADETLPAYLRRLVILDLDRAGGMSRTVTAANLGAQGLAPAEYAAWVEHFAYLQPDVICILPDPGSHALREGRFLPDRRSLAFTAFGYSPILPLVLMERGVRSGSAALGALGGLLARVDASGTTVPRAQRSSHEGLDDAVAISMRLASRGVVVVMPPEADADIRRARVAGPRVRVVDLAEVPALRDDDLRLDGFHLSAGGHSRAADAVAPAVLDLIHAAEPVVR